MTEPKPRDNYEVTMPSRPKYAARTDANQAQICSDLKDLGLGFEAYHAISRLADADCPGDVLVKGWHCAWRQVVWQPFEIKTAEGAPTAGQAEREDDVPIARTVNDILAWYGYEAERENDS